MFGIMLVIALMVFALAVFCIRGQREFFREAVLIGFVGWGAAVMFSTEALSLCHAIGFWEVLVFWIMIVMMGAFIIRRKLDTALIKALFQPVQGISSTGNQRPWPFLENT